MDEQDLALKIVPCALPRLAKAEDQRGLQALASKADVEVTAMMTEHSLRLLAQCIYEGGRHTIPSPLQRTCMQMRPPACNSAGKAV